MTIDFDIPIKVVSESNLRQHWAKRSNRTKDQRQVACQYTNLAVGRDARDAIKRHGATITFTRIAPRRLDPGNLGISFKGIQDGCCNDSIGMDDGDERWTMNYRQAKGKPREYGVRVTIETGDCDD